MIHHVTIEDTTWPVDVETDEENSAQWTLRYGGPEFRDQQRLSVASVLSAYEHLTNPRRSLEDVLASLRLARKARLVVDSQHDPSN